MLNSPTVRIAAIIAGLALVGTLVAGGLEWAGVLERPGIEKVE